MTVDDLIEKAKKFPGEAEVAVRIGQVSYDISDIRLALDENQEIYCLIE